MASLSTTCNFASRAAINGAQVKKQNLRRANAMVRGPMRVSAEFGQAAQNETERVLSRTKVRAHEFVGPSLASICQAVSRLLWGDRTCPSSDIANTGSQSQRPHCPTSHLLGSHNIQPLLRSSSDNRCTPPTHFLRALN